MQGVLERIRPGKKEERRLRRDTEELLLRITQETHKIDSRLKVSLLGSVSRGTWLRNEKDLDVFVFFPLEYGREDLEDVVTELGRRVLDNPEKHYAEHPYVMGSFRGYEVEIVPCYDVESPSNLKSAVDRTPFHNAFVKSRIGGKEDEVRLLKQFLKGISCYGAEAKVQGFSGYLSELLVLKYGSFAGVLEAAIKWRRGAVLSLKPLEDHDRIRNMFKSPLIFIDPVDSRRNVASALSEKNFSIFRHAAREYLKDPKRDFFFPRTRKARKEEVLKLLRDRGTSLVALFFPKPEILEDVLYTQGRKALKALEKVLKKGDFRVVGSELFVRESLCIIFELESLVIPALRLHLGPRNNPHHESRFLEKYRDYEDKITEPFIMDGRWAIFLRRRNVRADIHLEEFLSGGNLQMRGIPSHIATSLEKNFSLRTNREVFRREFLRDLQGFLDPRFPWEV
jgi:tRNA nucleotidyltransferase (CCA-adding enzyme)